MRHVVKRFVSILILVFVSSVLWASGGMDTVRDQEYDPERLFPCAGLKEDFAALRFSLEEGHGALYRYSTKQEMDDVFETAARKINRDMTEREFLRILLPVVAAVNCGHTSVQKTGFYDWLENQPVTFPLGFRYISGTPYLVRNYSDREDIVPGGELVSINGMPMNQIISDILPAIPSDAHIETSKFQSITSSVRFSQLYNVIYGVTRNYEVKYKHPKTGEILTVSLKGKNQAEIQERYEQRYPESAKTFPVISFREVEGVPVLTIRSFGSMTLKREGFNYSKFLRETFQALEDRSAEVLIIDLRENRGGNDAFGKLLFAHLTDKEFLYYAALEIKNNTFDFFKYTSIPKNRWTFSEKQARKNERGWYDVLGHPNLGIQKPIPPVFKGKVYVLINGRSFSATGETTSLMHYHKKAVFIGEECGSGYYGNTSGFMVGVELPQTGIRMGVPLVRYTMAVDGYPKDRGIIPDYPCEPGVEDVLANRDAVLEYAVGLARKNR
ncbi:MAG: hypothetical protein JXB26_09750 [Candidatus Aminicenantes bacterium]|nr:hypothetical protein [Candidatus Aminicenantes bacterium]